MVIVDVYLRFLNSLPVLNTDILVQKSEIAVTIPVNVLIKYFLLIDLCIHCSSSQQKLQNTTWAAVGGESLAAHTLTT